MPQPSMLPFSPNSSSFLTYIKDLATTHNIILPSSIAQLPENLQKEFSTSSNNAAIEAKRIASSLLPFFSQTILHHQHHPYFSQILFNNSFVNHCIPPSATPSFHLDNALLPDRTLPFHLSIPRKRRTKVNFSSFY